MLHETKAKKTLLIVTRSTFVPQASQGHCQEGRKTETQYLCYKGFLVCLVYLQLLPWQL